MELWILSSLKNSPLSIMAISLILLLLAAGVILATCFCVQRLWNRDRRPPARHLHEFHGMSHYLVNAMTSLTFTAVMEDNCASVTCAICLEDYILGERLRILPCCHRFHAICVDTWLTSWRTFCPVCKRDSRTGTTIKPPSESTPLLSSNSASSVLSSLTSISNNNTPYNHYSSFPSHNLSPQLSTSRGFVVVVDFSNAPSTFFGGSSFFPMIS